MRATLGVQKDDAKNTPETLKGDDNHASPPEEVPGSVNGDEDSTPV